MSTWTSEMKCNEIFDKLNSAHMVLCYTCVCRLRKIVLNAEYSRLYISIRQRSNIDWMVSVKECSHEPADTLCASILIPGVSASFIPCTTIGHDG